jgi:TetR/AcrR family transcriptional repressor of nem operon
MKVSKEQVALNRARIVDTAARLFRQKGYDGIGVADLMKSAGLTHGGFYGHFASKEDLLAEATAHALTRSVQRWQQKAAAASPAEALANIADHYLSTTHRDQPEHGCAVTALGSDVARLGPAVRSALAAGAAGQIAVLEQCLANGAADTDADTNTAAEADTDTEAEAEAAEVRRQALATYAAMVGAMVLARAVDDNALSEEILAAVRGQMPLATGR